MIVKQIVDEDFVNYKKPSMFIAFPNCDWKCEKECGMRVCQNGALATSPNIEIDVEKIVARYLNNQLTSAMVIGGLEPFYDFKDLLCLVQYIRDSGCMDDIVVYTGYTEEECKARCFIYDLISYKNIIVKFGRFVPNQEPHYDEVLGVMLASNNQYAKKIC